jgi:predicted Zn-dependent peptidase
MSPLDRERPPEPAAIRPFEFPHVDRSRLDNGLSLLSARYGRLPLVTVQAVIDAGTAGEPAERAGLAHLTANALDTGAGERTGDELAWAFERLGVELHADAVWDAVVVTATTASRHLDALLALVAEVVRRPSFPESEIERLRHEQVASILQRRKEPRALASDMAAHFIFGRDVPYARSLLGLRAHVEQMTPADVVGYHRSRFAPSTTTLMVVGDVEAEDARSRVVRHFGDWAGSPRTPPTFEVSPGTERSTVFVVNRPGAVQSEIRVGQVGVPRTHADYFALEVMNGLIGGTFTSRLNLSLREKHGFTYGVRSGFGYRRAAGPFLIHTAVGTDVTARAVEEILKELRSVAADGVTEDEVIRTRDYLAGVLPLQLQTTEQLAGRLAELVVHDLPADYFDDYRERVESITADDVVRVAREHLRLDNLAIVVVGDAESIADSLRAIDAGPVEVHEVPEE